MKSCKTFLLSVIQAHFEDEIEKGCKVHPFENLLSFGWPINHIETFNLFGKKVKATISYGL